MKKLITLIFAIIIAFPIIAGTKLISGDLSKLPGAKAIPVFVNWIMQYMVILGHWLISLAHQLEMTTGKKYHWTTCLRALTLRLSSMEFA